MIQLVVASFVLALGISLILTPLARALATRGGWLDHPDGRRKLHKASIARPGGVAVFLAFCLTLGVVVVFAPEFVSAQTYLPLVLACAAVMLVGLTDDLVGVSPASKILVQAVSAGYLYIHGYKVSLLTNPFGEPVYVGHVSFLLTVLWFVGMSNALNLIDGLDGLAAGVALLGSMSLLAAAALHHSWEASLMIAILGGALLGFLPYNFSPATIFLGDSGALFVGFALAAFAIQGCVKASAAIAIAVPLLALAVPILDVGLAILRRFLAGTGVFQADLDHIHHRLLRMGLTPRAAVISLYGVAAAYCSLALATMTGSRRVLWAGVSIAVLLTYAGIRLLRYVEFSELHRFVAQHLLTDRQTIANNVFLMRLRTRLREAESLARGWDSVVEAGSRLGFDRVEMVLSEEGLRSLHDVLVGGPRPRHWPIWHSDRQQSTGRPQWTWTIPLQPDGHRLGEIIVSRCEWEKPLGFEPKYLIDAITREFGARFSRLGPRPQRERLMPKSVIQPRHCAVKAVAEAAPANPGTAERGVSEQRAPKEPGAIRRERVAEA